MIESIRLWTYWSELVDVYLKSDTEWSREDRSQIQFTAIDADCWPAKR